MIQIIVALVMLISTLLPAKTLGPPSLTVATTGGRKLVTVKRDQVVEIDAFLAQHEHRCHDLLGHVAKFKSAFADADSRQRCNDIIEFLKNELDAKSTTSLAAEFRAAGKQVEKCRDSDDLRFVQSHLEQTVARSLKELRAVSETIGILRERLRERLSANSSDGEGEGP